MKQRIITGVCFIAAACAIIYFSDVTWFFRSLIAVITLCSLYELFRLKPDIGSGIGCGIAAVFAVLIGIFSVPAYKWILGVAFGVSIVTFVVLIVLLEQKRALSMRTLPLFFAMLMVVLFLSAGNAIRESQDGLIYLIFSILIPVATDTFAYFCGRFFGKHKLMPVTSPKKTIEGAVGGSLSALLLAVVAGLIYGQVNYVALCVYVLSASIVGQLGDLSLSALKRIAGVKDYGNLFPGHGGFLDRFDSILFVWPLSYLALSVGFDFIG